MKAKKYMNDIIEAFVIIEGISSDKEGKRFIHPMTTTIQSQHSLQGVQSGL